MFTKQYHVMQNRTIHHGNKVRAIGVQRQGNLRGLVRRWMTSMCVHGLGNSREQQDKGRAQQGNMASGPMRQRY